MTVKFLCGGIVSLEARMNRASDDFDEFGSDVAHFGLCHIKQSTLPKMASCLVFINQAE